MRSSRVPCIVFLAIVAAFVIPAAAHASGSRAPAPAADVGTAVDFEFLFLLSECGDLADAGDEAYQEWQQAEDVEDAVCSVYGVLSGQCAAAVIYSGVQYYQFRAAASAFLECHDAQ